MDETDLKSYRMITLFSPYCCTGRYMLVYTIKVQRKSAKIVFILILWGFPYNWSCFLHSYMMIESFRYCFLDPSKNYYFKKKTCDLIIILVEISTRSNITLPIYIGTFIYYHWYNDNSSHICCESRKSHEIKYMSTSLFSSSFSLRM